MQIPFGTEAGEALQAAEAEADSMGCTEITTGHLLLGLMRDERSTVSVLLHEAGLELNELRASVEGQASEVSEAKAPALGESSSGGFAGSVTSRMRTAWRVDARHVGGAGHCRYVALGQRASPCAACQALRHGAADA